MGFIYEGTSGNEVVVGGSMAVIVTMPLSVWKNTKRTQSSITNTTRRGTWKQTQVRQGKMDDYVDTASSTGGENGKREKKDERK